MRLTLTDKISHPGKTVNEDWFDHNDQAAWILDGASGIVKDTIPGAASDPQWLAQTTSDEIKRAWDNNLPTRDILLKASQNTIKRYETLIGDPAPPLSERPTACLTLVRLWEGKLEISWVGDSGAIHGDQDAVVTYGCVSSDLGKENDKIRDRLKALGLSQAELWEQMLPYEREFRTKANIDGGYKIVDLTTRWPDLMNVRTTEMRPGDRLLLLTDGLYRLIDVFKKYDAKSLVETAAQSGLSALYTQLRSLESNDEDCSRFIRAKISDDVCAALLTIG